MTLPENSVTARDLKETLQGLALAAGGCMKAAPSKVERTRLRLALVRALKVMKAPMADYETPPPGGRTDPAEMITDYVNSGGDWQALIAAITSRGRSGQTKNLFAAPRKGKAQCTTQWKN